MIKEGNSVGISGTSEVSEILFVVEKYISVSIHRAVAYTFVSETAAAAGDVVVVPAAVFLTSCRL